MGVEIHTVSLVEKPRSRLRLVNGELQIARCVRIIPQKSSHANTIRTRKLMTEVNVVQRVENSRAEPEAMPLDVLTRNPINV